MTLNEAIDLRRSRRKYLPSPIDPAVIETLEALAAQYSEAGNIRIEFVWNDGGAFDGLRKTYGLLTGVRNYAGLIGPKGDPAAAERLGYYGELLMLRAVALGLGTCWVGGSLDRRLCPLPLAENEEIVCTIALGPVQEKDSPREKLIYGVIHRKTKSIEEMMETDAPPPPPWFLEGMKAAQKAPSAVNRQPVKFSYKNGQVTAGVESGGTVSAMDLGIAKLHFELGAGQGKWAFGNHAAFDFTAK